MDIKGTIENIGFLFSSFLQTFIGIIISPKRTFEKLLNVPISKEEYKISLKSIIYAASSIIIGLFVASFLSVKSSPSIAIEIITKAIIAQIFLWVLYSIVLHLTAKLFGGKGTIDQSMSGMFYVLGTLHPFLILIISTISIVIPDVLSYDMGVRNFGEYGKTYIDYNEGHLNFFGLRLIIVYWSISFFLTMFYLYFPLKIAHKLSTIRIFFVYNIGFIFIFTIAIVAGTVASIFLLQK